MTVKEDILLNYGKFNAKYFSEKYNCPILKIYRLASDLKVSRGLVTKKEEVVNLVLKEYYGNKKTIKEIYKEFLIGKCSIGKILKENGSGGRIPEQQFLSTYNCNESFFEIIDTPEKAYWFGFIAADGNLYNGKLQICLAAKDKTHLEKFTKRIGYDGPLYVDKGNSRLMISRRKVFDDLCNLGLCPDKTFKIDDHVFDKIPPEFLSAAIHGYSDGDGSFCVQYRKSNKNIASGMTFSLVGNLSFLSFIKEYLSKFGVNTSTPKHDKRTKQTYFIYYWINKERLAAFEEAMYTNQSQDFLSRKKDKLLILK